MVIVTNSTEESNTMAKKNPVETCKVPSELILLALGDLAKVERAKKTYVVDMGSWHAPNSYCAVCFAGAVMAKSLNANPMEKMSPYDFGRIGNRLCSLDAFRCGDVIQGTEQFYSYNIPANKQKKLTKFRDDEFRDDELYPNGYWGITPYDIDPKEFKNDLRKLARKLATIGL